MTDVEIARQCVNSIDETFLWSAVLAAATLAASLIGIVLKWPQKPVPPDSEQEAAAGDEGQQGSTHQVSTDDKLAHSDETGPAQHTSVPMPASDEQSPAESVAEPKAGPDSKPGSQEQKATAGLSAELESDESLEQAWEREKKNYRLYMALSVCLIFVTLVAFMGTMYLQFVLSVGRCESAKKIERTNQLSQERADRLAQSTRSLEDASKAILQYTEELTKETRKAGGQLSSLSEASGKTLKAADNAFKAAIAGSSSATKAARAAEFLADPPRFDGFKATMLLSPTQPRSKKIDEISFPYTSDSPLWVNDLMHQMYVLMLNLHFGCKYLEKGTVGGWSVYALQRSRFDLPGTKSLAIGRPGKVDLWSLAIEANRPSSVNLDNGGLFELRNMQLVQGSYEGMGYSWPSYWPWIADTPVWPEVLNPSFWITAFVGDERVFVGTVQARPSSSTEPRGAREFIFDFERWVMGRSVDEGVGVQAVSSRLTGTVLRTKVVRIQLEYMHEWVYNIFDERGLIRSAKVPRTFKTDSTYPNEGALQIRMLALEPFVASIPLKNLRQGKKKGPFGSRYIYFDILPEMWKPLLDDD